MKYKTLIDFLEIARAKTNQSTILTENDVGYLYTIAETLGLDRQDSEQIIKKVVSDNSQLVGIQKKAIFDKQGSDQCVAYLSQRIDSGRWVTKNDFNNAVKVYLGATNGTCTEEEAIRRVGCLIFRNGWSIQTTAIENMARLLDRFKLLIIAWVSFVVSCALFLS